AAALATSGTTAQARSEEISDSLNGLHFPTEANVLRALFPAAPLLVVGVFLLFRRGAPCVDASVASPRTWKSWAGLALLIVGAGVGLFGLWALAQIANDPSWNPVLGEAVATIGAWVLVLVCAVGGFALRSSDRPADPGRGSPLRQGFRETMPVLGAILVAFAVARFLTMQEARSPGAIEQFLAAPTPLVNFECLPVGVSNNVVIVDVTTDVQRTAAELRVGFTGARLPGDVEESLKDAFFPPFSGTFVKPVPHAGNQPWRILPVGRQTWRMGFVLPDAAIARRAFENLRPIGPLPAKPRRTFAGTLFQVRQPGGAEYRASLNASAPITSGDPNWVAIANYGGNNESSVNLTWELEASRPGTAQCVWGDSRASAQLEQNPKSAGPPNRPRSKLYGTTIQIELTKVATNRVLLVTRMGGATTREELAANFRDLSEELLRARNRSFKTVRGEVIELCQVQGESFTVQVDADAPRPGHLAVATNTVAIPESASLTGQLEHDDAHVKLTWEVLASHAGRVELKRAIYTSYRATTRDPKSGSYRFAYFLELQPKGTNLVRLITSQSPGALHEEIVGNFRELADELIRTANTNATLAGGTTIELCRLQEKPLTIHLNPVLPSPESTRQPMAGQIGFPRAPGFPVSAVTASVVVLGVVIGSIVTLVVLLRRGGTAGKIAAMLVLVVPLALFVLVAVVLVRYRAKASISGTKPVRMMLESTYPGHTAANPLARVKQANPK
ncbi:MAG: hypothetical protein IAG10_31140, partial [Planctomycetaceae bacterium]|nr:hypothetical protein [Planctomycetaceae bacterium]